MDTVHLLYSTAGARVGSGQPMLCQQVGSSKGRTNRELSLRLDYCPVVPTSQEEQRLIQLPLPLEKGLQTLSCLLLEYPGLMKNHQ